MATISFELDWGGEHSSCFWLACAYYDSMWLVHFIMSILCLADPIYVRVIFLSNYTGVGKCPFWGICFTSPSNICWKWCKLYPQYLGDVQLGHLPTPILGNVHPPAAKIWTVRSYGPRRRSTRSSWRWDIFARRRSGLSDVLLVFKKKPAINIRELYNVRPPSDVCWFISLSNYSYKYHKP